MLPHKKFKPFIQLDNGNVNFKIHTVNLFSDSVHIDLNDTVSSHLTYALDI